MHFSHNSREFMNFFLNDIDKYMKKHNAPQQRDQDIIIKKLYNHLKFCFLKKYLYCSSKKTIIPNDGI